VRLYNYILHIYKLSTEESMTTQRCSWDRLSDPLANTPSLCLPHQVQAVSAIRAAKVEARCLVNGVGIVKLMGRSAGYIAAHASLASGDVDLCLVPEVDVIMEGPRSCLGHVKRCVETNGHAVVVVAEGAGKSALTSCACVGGNSWWQACVCVC
jgi:hypothetical protein